jgi:hypothetical protein
MSVQAARESLQIGRVFGLTYERLSRHAVPLGAMAVVFIAAPLAAWTLVLPSLHLGEMKPFAKFGVEVVIGWLGCISQGFTILLVLRDDVGPRRSLGELIGRSITKSFTLFVQSIAMSLGVSLGLILLIVPGVLFFARWSCAAPILLQDRRGPLEAMGRSADLTDHSRWRIAALAVMWIAAFLAVDAGFGVILAALGLYRDGSGHVSLLGLLVPPLSTVVFNVIAAAGEAVIYLELRRLRQGGSANETAAVFA